MNLSDGFPTFSPESVLLFIFSHDQLGSRTFSLFKNGIYKQIINFSFYFHLFILFILIYFLEFFIGKW